jgi:hypothetical protein
MRVKVIKGTQEFEIGSFLDVSESSTSEYYYNVNNSFYNILKENCEIIEESNHIAKKINSEYHFTKEVNGRELLLILYIDYEKKTYDFAQNNEEGIMPKDNNECTEINKAYFELGLEVLKFVQSELYE